MTIFSGEILARDIASPANEKRFLKAVDLLNTEYQIVGVTVQQATGGFGANEDDSMVQKGILKLGETLRYTFNNVEGHQKLYDSKSLALYIAFTDADLEPGQWIKISKTGAMKNTRYTITKIDKK